MKIFSIYSRNNINILKNFKRSVLNITNNTGYWTILNGKKPDVKENEYILFIYENENYKYEGILTKVVKITNLDESEFEEEKKYLSSLWDIPEDKNIYYILKLENIIKNISFNNLNIPHLSYFEDINNLEEKDSLYIAILKIYLKNYLNLYIDEKIYYTFYNSLKSKGFVILAGLSGTGKTKIFEEFIKCFPKNNSLFVPIRPDFRDSKSLLVYYNPLKSKYNKTPLLEFILKASKNYLEKGENADPFFVLFDEMNLARVEYYFADFLSILESKKFNRKDEALENHNFMEFIQKLGRNELRENNYKFTSQSIKLHNEESVTDIPKELFLPPNLYFVGTVNIDETTHMFSPKVLDRAFTIEFDVDDFKDYLEFLKENPTSVEIPNELKEELKKDFTNEGSFIDRDKSKILEFLQNEENEEFLKKLNEINNILRPYNLHFGYRVFDEIILFLYHSQNSKMPFGNLNEAFDLAIKMKVLPKFHGTKQKLEKPIEKLLEYLGVNDIDKKIENGIPSLEEIGVDFKYTVHKLLEMLYKLKTQGFASYM